MPGTGRADHACHGRGAFLGITQHWQQMTALTALLNFKMPAKIVLKMKAIFVI
jgi:hypothetical protein